MNAWQCSVCKYVSKDKNPPEKCPICGVPASKFKKIIDEALIPSPAIRPKKPVEKEIFKEVSMFGKIQKLLVKHHIHPITVHTPNGIIPLIAILFAAAWIFNYDLLSRAAFINMVFVMLALPVVVYTGIIEWQKKYRGAYTKVFKKKITAAVFTTFLSIVSFVWYIVNPDVLSSSLAWLFILVNIIMVIAVGIAGHIGGKLVFKD